MVLRPKITLSYLKRLVSVFKIQSVGAAISPSSLYTVLEEPSTVLIFTE